MSKVESAKIPREQRQELEKELLQSFGTFGITEEGKRFVKDLLTESEMVMLARRLQIARRLLQGHSYRRIAKDLRVGLDTVEKVHHWLDSKFEDYRHVLPPLLRKGSKRMRKRSVPIELYSFRDIRRRYPARMLLFNILIGDPRMISEEEETDEG